MLEDTAQSLKVEQDDMGTVLDAASRFKPVKLALVATGENSSPVQGAQSHEPQPRISDQLRDGQANRRGQGQQAQQPP
jgi:hypothetical protein